MAYQCTACGKFRCVFAAKQFGARRAAEVREASEAEMRSGDSLFPSDHPLHDEVFVKEGITCNAPIQAAYYIALEKTKLRTLAWICSFCGDQVGTAEDAASSQVLRPLCHLCESSGLKPSLKPTRKLPKFFDEIVACSEDADVEPAANADGDDTGTEKAKATGPKTGYRVFMADSDNKVKHPAFKDRAAAWTALPDADKAAFVKQGDRNRKASLAANKRALPKELSEAMASGKKRRAAKAASEPPKGGDAVEHPPEPIAKVARKASAFFEQPLTDFECVSDVQVRTYAMGPHGGAKFAGNHIMPGEIFSVLKAVQDPEKAARCFYKLADGRGWVSNLSRKDDSKVVVRQVVNPGSAAGPSMPPAAPHAPASPKYHPPSPGSSPGSPATPLVPLSEVGAALSTEWEF